MGKINNKLLFALTFFFALFVISVISSSIVSARVMYTPYTPIYSSDDIKNVSKSGCAPPETVTGCAACYDGFKQDCVYYFLNSPEQCSVVYTEKQEKESCYYFVFREKIKQSDAIISTCKLFETETDQNMCFMYLVPYYGDKSSICGQITVDSKQHGSYKDTCIMDYALEKKDPLACGDLRWVDSMLECCTGAKGIKEQYVTTRQDLIDSFTAKYGKELDQCRLLLNIKSAETVASCEDLNCECLSPCNKLKDDARKQQDCVIDCAYKYVTCYGSKKTDFPQVSRERFMQQSFYGVFSRKHCSEYQGSLSASLKKDDHAEKTEPAECTSNDECGEKRLCDACGKCRDEKELVMKDLVKVSFDIKPDNTELKIKNVISENTVFRVNVKPIFTYTPEDREVKYCDMLTPGIKQDVKLVAALDMPDDEIFSGFTTGQVLDARDKTLKCTIDLKEGTKKCPFIIAPDDSKKPVGTVLDIDQTIKLFVAMEDEKNPNNVNVIDAYEDKLSLTLLKAGPKLSINIGGLNQVQDGGTKVINFKVDDPDTNIIMVNAKVIGIGKLYMPHEEAIDLSSLSFTIDPKNGGAIVYKAPELSNIDLGKELSSLSMVSLQTEAGKQILTDAAFAYVDTKLDKLTSGAQAKSDIALSAYQRYLREFPEAANDYNKLVAQYAANSRKAKEFSDKLNTAVNGYKLGKGYINDLPGVNSGIKDSQDVVSVNVEQSSSDGPTTTERVANIGVSAITVAQLGVSVLTFVPNKIPGVGKMTSGFQVAFSAATNIWKANFKYIAQDEKLGRAKELFIPVMVLITVEDVSGWQAQQAVMLKVAYHQVD